jgi:hypothetical protein
MRRHFPCLLLLLLFATSHGAASHEGKVAAPVKLWDEFSRFSGPKSDLIDAYQKMHSMHWSGAMSENEQLLSTSDAMLGRYEQAQREMDTAFHNASAAPAACPGNLATSAFDQWLETHLAGFDLVMVNEAHNQPMSRALIYQMLPIMRRNGFSILALEALPDAATTRWINEHGFALDERSHGFYLREPIEGEIVRQARRLGFTLANYDAFTADREEAEAANLAGILKAHPGKKVFAVAGYAHIRRIDGRMAQRLPKLYDKPFLSIDQLGVGKTNDVMRNVCTLAGSSESSKGAGALTSMRWAPGGRGADIIVVRTGNHVLDRAAASGNEWLSLGGERWRYPFSIDGACAGATCLVEARYVNEPANAVPADRYLALAGEHAANLFLRDGEYAVTYRNAGGAVTHMDSVTVREGRFIH